MSDALRLERRGQVLVITLDRPKAAAIDAKTSRAMAAAFDDFQADPDLRLAVLTGAGERIFSAGWDLATAEDEDQDYGPGGLPAKACANTSADAKECPRAFMEKRPPGLAGALGAGGTSRDADST